jgi:Bromodomain extra-terminal - transcription regulation
LHERVGALHNQLIAAVEAMPSAPQSSMHGREMTFAEKRRLSSRLGQIQSVDVYQAVLNIVAKDPRVSMTAEGDVELEIDELKTDTLWKLHELVERPAGKPAAAQSRPISRPAPAPQPAVEVAEEEAPVQAQNGTHSVQSSG